MHTHKLEALEVWRMEPTIPGPRIGTVVGFGAQGSPLVRYPGMLTAPCPARVVAALGSHVLQEAHRDGAEVLLVFEAGNPRQPIIVDLLRGATVQATAQAASDAKPAAPQASIAALPPAQPTLALHIGRILSIADAWLDVELWLPGGRCVARARAACVLDNANEPVLLAEVDGAAVVDDLRWLVVGQLQQRLHVREGNAASGELVVTAKSIRLHADSELELVAGNTRLQLTAQGRLVAIADDVVSRARMTNRVMGGSVQLN